MQNKTQRIKRENVDESLLQLLYVPTPFVLILYWFQIVGNESQGRLVHHSGTDWPELHALGHLAGLARMVSCCMHQQAMGLASS